MTKATQDANGDTELFSISGLNEKDDCNHAEDMVYIDPRNDKETPWVLQILGYQADAISRQVQKQIDREQRRKFKAERSGKVVDPRPISDALDESYESIAKCVVGWSGTNEEYSPSLCLQAVSNNESLRDQIKKFSEDLGNFGNGKN